MRKMRNTTGRIEPSQQEQPAEKRRKLGEKNLEVSDEGNGTWRKEKV